MANSSRVPWSSSFNRRVKHSFQSFFFISLGLSLLTCCSIFLYISCTSKLSDDPLKINPTRIHIAPKPRLQFYSIITPAKQVLSSSSGQLQISDGQQFTVSEGTVNRDQTALVRVVLVNGSYSRVDHHLPRDQEAGRTVSLLDEQPAKVGGNEGGNSKVDKWDVYHDRDLFMQEYKEMNKSFKVFIYPHKPNDPFKDLLLPERKDPRGNYASENYFKKNLFKSHFITEDPSEADLFYLPFSIATLRHDKRVGVGGIQNFVRDYVHKISHDYPYWNRTGGADHFYIACHSIGKVAMKKTTQVKTNAIQVVCSSSYFLTGYVSHKDASIPQIWPRKGNPTRSPSKRKKLAFYAGAMNSKERKFLVQVWENDDEISVHKSRLKTPYSEALLGSKFCLHAKGFEVNTARIGDALFYGCVPVILADYYDLPFADILNWETFSVVMMSADIPKLKKILAEQVRSKGYLRLHKTVMEVRKHFQWHDSPIDYDAFYMAMFELWLRRSHLRVL